jgi:very-short-patch-repair endonuclease
MKHNRFNYEYRDNASKRHKLVGDLLRNSFYFQNYQSYQEWPVEKINANWKSGREHFDWVVPSLKLVIEVHGDDSSEEYKKLLYQKEQAAIAAGWTFLYISAEDTITAEWILERYRTFYDKNKPVQAYKLSGWANNYENNKRKQNINETVSNDITNKRVHKNKYSHVKSR